jgi:hypothetical protein
MEEEEEEEEERNGKGWVGLAGRKNPFRPSRGRRAGTDRHSVRRKEPSTRSQWRRGKSQESRGAHLARGFATVRLGVYSHKTDRHRDLYG